MKSADQIISEIKNIIVDGMQNVADPAATKILSGCIDELRKMQKELSTPEIVFETKDEASN